jgi:hypothetical protein
MFSREASHLLGCIKFAYCSPQVLLLDDHPTYLREARFAGEPKKIFQFGGLKNAFFHSSVSSRPSLKAPNFVQNNIPSFPRVGIAHLGAIHLRCQRLMGRLGPMPCKIQRWKHQQLQTEPQLM